MLGLGLENILEEDAATAAAKEAEFMAGHEVTDNDLAEHEILLNEVAETAEAHIQSEGNVVESFTEITEATAALESLCLTAQSDLRTVGKLFVSNVKTPFARLANGNDALLGKLVPSIESLDTALSTAETVVASTTELNEPKTPGATGKVGEQPEDVVVSAGELAGEDKAPASATQVENGVNVVEQSTPVVAVLEQVVTPPSTETDATDVKLEDFTASVEGIGSAIGRVVGKVVDNFRKVGKSIADHFSHVFQGFSLIKRRAYQIREKAKGIKTELRTAKTEFSGLHRLSVNGKVDGESILKGLDNAVKVADFSYNGYLNSVGAFYQGMGKHIAEAEAHVLKSTSFGALSDGIADFRKSWEDETKRAFGTHANKLPLPGDRVWEYAAGHYPILKKAKGAQSVLSRQETDALTAKQVVGVANDIKELADKFDRYDEIFMKVLHMREKSLNDAYKAVTDRGEKPDHGKGFAQWIVTGYAYGYIWSVTELGDYLFTVARSALAYCEASLKHHQA